MATITLKNVPEELVLRLKKQAAEHRRSLNQEAIAQLLMTTSRARPLTVEELTAFLAEQEEEGIWINPEDTRRFITEGRL
ncbi:MAG: hypothetical protein HY875_05165 [Chloroflexi bacterium]|nr:hypothetical protein [Chloroflexota bacterium]